MATTAIPTGETLAERFDRQAGRETLDRLEGALDDVVGGVAMVDWCVSEGEAVLWHASGDGPSPRGRESGYLSENRDDLPVVTAETVGTLKLFADEVLERTAEMRRDAESILRNLRALYEGSSVATEQMSKGRGWRREEADHDA